MDKRGIKEYFIQVTLIVFSVVLGLYLSERIEERKNRIEANHLLDNIKLEVIDNGKLIKEWAPYHMEILEKMDSLINDDAFINKFVNDRYHLFEEILTRNTFMRRMPTNDAWDIAKSHPLIVNIGYEKQLILSRIYSQQKSTFEPAQELFALLKTVDFNSEKNARANLNIVKDQMQELVGREISLVTYFREAKDILDINYD